MSNYTFQLATKPVPVGKEKIDFPFEDMGLEENNSFDIPAELWVKVNYQLNHVERKKDKASGELYSVPKGLNKIQSEKQWKVCDVSKELDVEPKSMFRVFRIK